VAGRAWAYRAPEQHHEASVALAAGDYEKAERLCAETLKLEPRMNWAWFWLGSAQSKQSKYDRAIESYTKVIQMFESLNAPPPHYAYLARGLAYRAKGMEAQAKPDLAVALPIMIDVLRHTDGAMMFDYADDPLYGKHPKPTPEVSRAKMCDRLRLATGQAPAEATASDERRVLFWENWWKVHAPEYGVVTR
jgi:tetratricopeptide (TPR) repeat protein